MKNDEIKIISQFFVFLCFFSFFSDNSCEINLMDAYEKGTVRPDQFDKVELPKEKEDLAGKYVTKLRKTASKIFLKKSI